MGLDGLRTFGSERVSKTNDTFHIEHLKTYRSNPLLAKYPVSESILVYVELLLTSRFRTDSNFRNKP